MKLSIRVEPEFCGSFSIGTVEIIKLIREQLNLELAEAKSYIDSCVFNGETVLLPIPPGIDVEKLLIDIRDLKTVAKIEAFVVKE